MTLETCLPPSNPKKKKRCQENWEMRNRGYEKRTELKIRQSD